MNFLTWKSCQRLYSLATLGLLFVAASFGLQFCFPSLCVQCRAQTRDSGSGEEVQFEESPLVGTTIQLPTLGVSIDANGLLEAKMFADPRGELIRKRILAAKANLKGNLRHKVKLRKISLKRLELELKRRREAGKQPSEAMECLAGLTRVEYVFVDPDNKDIILAGPAEPWIENQSGRRVGVVTGKPMLLLDDLIAALRTFSPNKRLNQWVACSIDPTPQGIAKLKEFQKTIPRNIPQSARAEAAVRLGNGLRESLGNAEIKVYGVPRETHMAQVMVEADYRMKLMAVGLEQPPIKMTTFIAALRGAPKDMQRWWFMPNYKCVKVGEDKNSMQLVGDGVVLSTQKIDFDQKARIVATGAKSSAPAKKFASSFTKKYGQISKVRPIYAQLRNIIDLLVAAAWIKKSDAFTRSGWEPTTFLDERVYSIQNQPNPKRCPCVANAVWKGHVLILPAGGGVSIAAAEALSEKNLIKDTKGDITKTRKSINLIGAGNNWWWD